MIRAIAVPTSTLADIQTVARATLRTVMPHLIAQADSYEGHRAIELSDYLTDMELALNELATL